ncbi:HEL058Cp [Eremothecium sinecaudum]|uniref:HEL058Cp n=1 Tax=Eremothecium sinecaudum TaxID=45286 RepID=A0A0X8HTL3_9SACH|nr:HEL058Cp [Eremothecium sinecaudum]AMD21222.1 HEL058Cp [Eremothecium sinecaudum]
MPDLTHLFNRYVEVIKETENTHEATQWSEDVEKRKQLRGKFRVEDSFIKECYELLKHIFELKKVILSLEKSYMSEVEMSEKEKDDFDVEARLQLQQYIEKLKYLERYEMKRQNLMESKALIDTATDLFGLLSGKSKEINEFHKTNNQFRNGVLQSVGMWLSKTSMQLSQMQRARLHRQQELDSIDFNAQLYMRANQIASVAQTPAIETTKHEIKQYEDTMSMLSQQQIQELETEHEELLNQKTKELMKVQKLSKTVMEVASLQNELATHLQVQTENINTLLYNNEDVTLDIQQGNRQLRKAQERGGKSALMIIYMSIIFGLLILFLDYIN